MRESGATAVRMFPAPGAGQSPALPPAIEPMLHAHLEEVARLDRDICPDPWSLGNFRDSLRAGHSCWVAGSPVVAYAVMLLAADEASLLTLGVAPAARRQGLGRALLQRLMDVARTAGAVSLWLEVRESNAAARQLYAAAGFQERGRRRRFYPTRHGREDALTLERIL